ncbi:S8 family serine peptidase [Ornithinimicrobium tianjinense]|uniref:Extracellular protease n=1 Tax=Ornithinimicrobium tianjinense TaxID=1195761 RepID=A0A917F4Y0_9MICO|nr:S8 family serine peptidase [Ornithinimicrobium tianjinense]GGF50745.1 extracellular protease [Ornithinimicrobium tianjinense]
MTHPRPLAALLTAAGLILPAAALAAVPAAAAPTVAPPPALTTAPTPPTAAQASAQGYDEIIVAFAPGSASTAAKRSAALDAAAVAQGVELREVRTLGTGARLVSVDETLSGARLEGLLRSLSSRQDVEYAEPNLRMYPTATPNDPAYSDQWHYFENTGSLRLPSAWDRADGLGTVVAVLDTGITSHPDLNANVVSGYDMISDSWSARDGNGRDSNPADQGDWMAAGECGNGYPQYTSNSSWHGTHVAGTVAAVSSNGTGVAGVAPKAKISPVRVLGRCGGTLADIADGITWASGGYVSGLPSNASPADVINMSLGGGGYCASTYQSAINGAVQRGVPVVVAAGNDNQNAGNVQPANCSNVITVGSTDRQGNRAYYSNYGTVLDISAPGGETDVNQANGVLSTLNTGTTYPASSSYAYYQGTSMATPHVAGLVALMLGEKSMTPSAVETALKDYSRPLPGSCSGGCGAGIVDATATINGILGGTTPPPPPGGIVNGGFESGATGWSGDTWTINTESYPARTGSYKAWLLGYGTTTQEDISQTVTVPSGGTLSFYLRVDSAETTTTTAYDTMRVQLHSTSGSLLRTLATYSNVNETSGYVLKSFDLSGYAGQQVRLTFDAQEDTSYQTSFLVDDVSLN